MTSCEPAPVEGSDVIRAPSAFAAAAAAAFACLLSACGTSGPPVTAPDLVARDLPATGTSEADPLAAPADAASLPEDASEPYDPYEEANRAMFERNQRFNRAVIYPLARAYDKIPEPVRHSVENFVSNLAEPMVFANNVLQLRLGAAATTAGRFALNSTVGLAGLADVASKSNLPQQSGDFGQTLYVWGYRKSPYLVLPVIGPTNVRDLFGNTIELVATIPAGQLLPTQVASTANNLSVAGSIATPFTKLDEVGDMKTLEESSVDFYAMLRSVVEQKRQAELQEALATSGWTRRYRPMAQPAETIEEPFAPEPMPKSPTQEFMAGSFQGSNE